MNDDDEETTSDDEIIEENNPQFTKYKGSGHMISQLAILSAAKTYRRFNICPLPPFLFHKQTYYFSRSTESRTQKLPSAIAALSCGNSTSSIFCNPFREAEEAEFHLLETHVKLSERKKIAKPVKKSRLVCKMFRKGRCRLDDQCRFSHTIGSALLARLAEPSADDQQEQASRSSPPQSKFESEPVRYNAREEIIEEENPLKKKRHVGITDSLIPPKRAMKLFDQQVKSETPWSAKR